MSAYGRVWQRISDLRDLLRRKYGISAETQEQLHSEIERQYSDLLQLEKTYIRLEQELKDTSE